MLTINIPNTRRILTEIGLALVPVSIPLGMIVKVLFGNMLFGNMSMLLGLLLIFPFHRITQEMKPSKLAGIIFFFLLAYLYFFLSKFNELIYLLYLGVTLIYAIELSFLHYGEDVRCEKVIFYIWLFSFLSVLGGYIGFATGQIGLLSGAFSFNETGETIIYDGLTMGSVAITQMTCSFFFISLENIKKHQKLLLTVLIVLDFFMVLLSYKRTPLVISLFVIFYYLRRLNILAFSPKRVLALIIILVGITIYILSSPELSEAVAIIAEDTFTGIINLVTGTHTGHSLTNSTDMRLESRQQAFDMIADSSILRHMIGSGFMTFWFDMPLIQAYLDMGVIGICWYAYYIVYLPLRVMLTQKRENDLLCVTALLCVYGTISSITSGHPYAHQQWLPVCLLCFVLANEQTKENSLSGSNKTHDVNNHIEDSINSDCTLRLDKK